MSYHGTMEKISKGQHAFFIRSGVQILEVQVLNVANGFCTIRFLDTGGGIRVRESKLFATKEEAEENVKKINNSRRQSYKPYW